MRKILLSCCLFSMLGACKVVTKFGVGLQLKHHRISDAAIISYTQKHYASSSTYGKLKPNFFSDILADSSLVTSKDSLAMAAFAKYIGQPLNCLFFNEQQNLIAAYAICDADLHRYRLTWQDYLERPKLVENISVKQNLTYSTMLKYITVLKDQPQATSGYKTAILVWSKVGGRQTKFFLKEFHAYLTKHNYKVHVVNCDEALTNATVSKSRI
jgi:hypothetical protein